VATQKTRCPYCSSAFTVSSAQLAIRDGYVRCGKCFQVFKADDYLILTSNPQKEDEKSTPDQTNPITSIRTGGFDTALDNFIDKTDTNSAFTRKYTKPNTHLDNKTENTAKTLSNQNPKPLDSVTTALPSAVKPIPTSPPSLGHELNEQWVKGTTNIHQGFTAKPSTEQSPSSQNIPSSPLTEDRSKKSQGLDDDLMNYLNNNSVPAGRMANLKTDRTVPSMNDFHANQRSKKKYSDLPMQYEKQVRNIALDNLKKRRFQFRLDLPSVITWLTLSLLMVVLLAAQYLFFNFNELAANPRYQPTMHKACLYLGCDVPFIDINKIKINNALGVGYIAGSTSATRFTATMTNVAEANQPYPHIRLLVLKNKKILSGRVLQPSEYLTKNYNSQARLSPNRPIQIEFIIQISRDQIPVFALDPVQ
jgi:predicted Zn finger-like uncharacterized protein